MDEGCKADPNARTPWEEIEHWKERAEKAEARVKELEDSHKKLLDGISEDCAKMRSILGSE